MAKKTEQNTPVVKDNDKEILDEIKATLESGSYRKQRTQQSPKAEDKVSVVINEITETVPVEIKVEKESSEKKGKKKKTKKEYQKTTTSHKLKVLGSLVVLGIFTGSGLGAWYFNSVLSSNVDYGNLDISQYIAQPTQVLEDKFGITSNHENWVSQVAGNYTPQDLEGWENLTLALYNAENATSFSAIGTGRVLAMGTTQTIYSARKFDGQTYTFESISAGLVTVSSCDVIREIKPNGDFDVEVYDGQNTRADGADWIYNQTISKSEFEEINGVLPNAIQPYLISESTVTSSSEIRYDDQTGYYSFDIELDPLTSVLLYYKQVQRSGGLNGAPEFFSIKQTITIDENWNLICLDITESYKSVKFGMAVTCNGTLHTDYTFNQPVDLPI